MPVDDVDFSLSLAYPPCASVGPPTNLPQLVAVYKLVAWAVVVISSVSLWDFVRVLSHLWGMYFGRMPGRINFDRIQDEQASIAITRWSLVIRW